VLCCVGFQDLKHLTFVKWDERHADWSATIRDERAVTLFKSMFNAAREVKGLLEVIIEYIIIDYIDMW
jgi:hypothetical protein